MEKDNNHHSMTWTACGLCGRARGMRGSRVGFAALGFGVHCFITVQILIGSCFCIVMFFLLANGAMK